MDGEGSHEGFTFHNRSVSSQFIDHCPFEDNYFLVFIFVTQQFSSDRRPDLEFFSNETPLKSHFLVWFQQQAPLGGFPAAIL